MNKEMHILTAEDLKTIAGGTLYALGHQISNGTPIELVLSNRPFVFISEIVRISGLLITGKVDLTNQSDAGYGYQTNSVAYFRHAITGGV